MKRVYFDGCVRGIGEVQIWSSDARVLHIKSGNIYKEIPFSDFDSLSTFFDWIIFGRGFANNVIEAFSFAKR